MQWKKILTKPPPLDLSAYVVAQYCRAFFAGVITARRMKRSAHLLEISLTTRRADTTRRANSVRVIEVIGVVGVIGVIEFWSSAYITVKEAKTTFPKTPTDRNHVNVS